MNPERGIHGECLVRMLNRELKKVKHVRVADEVWTQDEQGARIQIILQMSTKGTEKGKGKGKGKEQVEMIRFPSGLLISCSHPIQSKECEHRWGEAFRQETGQAEFVVCPYLFDFVLDRNHSLCINEIQCASLGHDSLRRMENVSSYFGTERVVQDLKKLSVVTNGHALVSVDDFTTTEKGKVNGLEFKKTIVFS